MATTVPAAITLEFSYESVARAELIERAISQEIGQIDDSRAQTTIERDGRVLLIEVIAEDLVALRAGLNTWCTLIEVAERCAER
ncbi:KEOPS complex subunit Pcc1 [Halocatena halophila]|uniref:KEOPS complex subunit Pcc1 n=1 Tax=Halocatena halophila TaxID=2814576 RepID=UPI002ED4D06B